MVDGQMDMINSDRNVNEAYMHGVMTDIKRLMVHKKVSRDELCDFIKEKTGKRVTVSTVDAWFKESRPDMSPPLTVLLYICEFLSSFEPINQLFTRHKWRVVKTEEYGLMEIGRLYQELNNRSNGGNHPAEH